MENSSYAEKSRRRQPSGRRSAVCTSRFQERIEGRGIRRAAQAVEVFAEIIGFLLEPAKGGLAIVIERAVSRRPLGASAGMRPSAECPQDECSDEKQHEDADDVEHHEERQEQKMMSVEHGSCSGMGLLQNENARPD
jgi:hypothetical protein